MIATVFLSLLVITPQADGRPPSQFQGNYMMRLISSCEDGLGQACYDYAVYLRDVIRVKEPQAIQKYIHRACQLTYQPACGRPDKPERAIAGGKSKACANQQMSMVSLSTITTPQREMGLQVTRLQPASVFAKAGMKLGDVLLKLNGKAISSYGQLLDALGPSPLLIEVRREAVTTSLVVMCSG